jgi:hypothetical protein
MILSILAKLILAFHTFSLETHLLIQSNCSMIVSDHSQLDPMHTSGSSYGDTFIHQGSTKPSVLKFLMQINEEISRPSKPRISSERNLKMPNNLLTI